MSQKPLKIAVLVSGSGSNLQVMIDAMKSGNLAIDIVGVISNREDAYAITRAKDAGIPVSVLSHVPNGRRMGINTFEKYALQQIQDWSPDLVVLAGFMRVLSAQFINNMPCAMINLHPSLLPYYKGLDTHQRVLRSGDNRHGCSVHLVTAELDAGQVLTQAWLSVRTGDTVETLAKRVQVLEHQLVPFTISLIIKGVISIQDAKTAKSGSMMPLPLKLWLDQP
ncbi:MULTISPECIES: phosphoribosylglycinamide formyltransferase [Moraxella]|uniref:Phosphoribosylglycinamide formyltransferase n=1 Tax=Moraxella catarrhalis TaxID=480 RepID=A0A7Z0UX48_MORCA|nr:phosphoribosylglycinamide formyltransferase [Moraxella catarrhalis]OAU99559.1 Phosphoribosylglycinamide formyltransferase [Moraxella catarrhalis]STY81460.1 Phosphoribosylglycinamide formyltransferase [Moraxella catarrhalis]